MTNVQPADSQRVLVVGAGGHAKVVADILRRSGITVIGFLDDDRAAWGMTRLGLPVLGGTDSYAAYDPTGLVMGIGSNRARAVLVERLAAASELWVSAIHPTAVVAESVTIGRGVVVAAGAVINPDARIDDFAIVNTGATIDHDCVIGAYAHVAPGVHISGGARVGVGTLIGVGSAMVPRVSVGAWATVGAGAAVASDLPDGCTAVGVPARVVRDGNDAG